MTNTNKEALVRFIMSAVKKYPGNKGDINPVVFHSSFMMTIDEIKKAMPGKHKETFEKEMSSALFNYRKHFKPQNEYENESIGHYLSNMIQNVLSKVWFSMSNNSKEEYLSKLKKDVLNEIRKGYFDPISNYGNLVNNAPNAITMRNFHNNRYNLMKKLIVEKQVMPLTKEAKAKKNAKIQALLMSLKRHYTNGQLGQAMYSARDGLRAAARNEPNQKKIKNTRKNLMANLEARSTNARVKQKEMERIKTLLMSLQRMKPQNKQMGNAMSTVKEQLKAAAKNPENYKRINNTRKKLLFGIQEGVHAKHHGNLEYSMPFKPWGRPIPGYRNNTGAYYPRNKNPVPSGKEENWRYKR